MFVLLFQLCPVNVKQPANQAVVIFIDLIFCLWWDVQAFHNQSTVCKALLYAFARRCQVLLVFLPAFAVVERILVTIYSLRKTGCWLQPEFKEP